MSTKLLKSAGRATGSMTVLADRLMHTLVGAIGGAGFAYLVPLVWGLLS